MVKTQEMSTGRGDGNQQAALGSSGRLCPIARGSRGSRNWPQVISPSSLQRCQPCSPEDKRPAWHFPGHTSVKPMDSSWVPGSSSLSLGVTHTKKKNPGTFYADYRGLPFLRDEETGIREERYGHHMVEDGIWSCCSSPLLGPLPGCEPGNEAG